MTMARAIGALIACVAVFAAFLGLKQLLGG